MANQILIPNTSKKPLDPFQTSSVVPSQSVTMTSTSKMPPLPTSGAGAAGGGGQSWGGTTSSAAPNQSIPKPYVPPTVTKPAVTSPVVNEAQNRMNAEEKTFRDNTKPVSDYSVPPPAVPPDYKKILEDRKAQGVPDSDLYNNIPPSYLPQDTQYGESTPIPGTPQYPVAKPQEGAPQKDYMADYDLTASQIQKDLETSQNAIKEKYRLELEDAKRVTENERMSSLSNLYSAGDVDPRSSSVLSVNDMTSRRMQEREANINSRMSQELSSAADTAFGRKTKAADMMRTQQQDTEDTAQQKYENDRAVFEDSWKNVSNALAVYSTGKQMQREEKQDAQDSIKTLFSYGSTAFEGVDQKTQNDMEKAAGFPTGSITRALKTIKQLELQNKQVETYEHNNSMYYNTYDESGTPTPHLLLKGTPKASSGSGGGAGGINTGQYGTDLDAIIGNTLATIPSKFGQQTFREQIGRARNDADKISTVASVVLKNQPAEVRRDFTNQSIAVKNIDKAISLLDQGAKTGVLRAGTQYAFNVFGKDFDPNLTAVNSYLISAIQPYRNSITGAAWGDQEDGEYAQLFGSTKYSPAELKDRLQRIREIMKDKSVSALNSYVNPMDTYQNYFEQGQGSGGNSGGDRLTVNNDGTYTYINNDGSVHRGEQGDGYKDKTNSGGGDEVDTFLDSI